MGITISFQGALGEGGDADAVLAFARQHAHDMEWAALPVDLSPAQALLPGEALERPRLRGLTLVPHFACEPLPLLFAGAHGTLVDTYMRAPGDAGPVHLDLGPLLKTQFGGPAVHDEVCRFLQELRERFLPGLTVDDETGYFDTWSEDDLARAFDRAWGKIARELTNLGLEPGSVFDVAGCEFRVGPSAEEFAEVPEDVRSMVVGLAETLGRGYSGMGLELDGSPRSIQDLDLLMMEVDEAGMKRRPQSPDTEGLVHQLGAYFGRALVSAVGGHWKVEEADGLHLVDIGGVGLKLNPFEVASERLMRGPAWGFALHLQLCETFKRWIPHPGDT